ncbi:MAG TPA: aminotransferase class III-fold pyridoxal phosphate-dependent enzyme, partial [Actinomycetota bacterium]|nr:aminotransferase class III-fold pyridoxal phosphate-dependent enzyme [Actinomycetota bacterium]
IVFVADEIQSGMGRAGRWYAIEDEDVVPDVVLTAKSLGGGLPISAATGREEIMDAVHVGGLGGTYGGNPVAAAAALAVLEKIERERLLERSRAIGETIASRFARMQERFAVVGDARGRGAMRAIELVADRTTKEPLGADAMVAIGRAALERGVIVLTAGTYGNVVRLLPPITIDDGLLEEGLDLLDEALVVATG